MESSRCAILVATPDASGSGWVQREYEAMVTRRDRDPLFHFIPVLLGRFPDFPFLKSALALDFGGSRPETYRRAFRRLLCGIERGPLCTLLARDDLGRLDPWSEDEPVRRLYWSNLIHGREDRLRWRCPLIRRMGREILGCQP